MPLNPRVNNNAKILVVDNNPPTRELLSSLVEAECFDVLEAGSS